MKHDIQSFLLSLRWDVQRRGCAGTTLAEVLIGGAILTVIIAGTSIAFGTAARIEGSFNGPKYVEAASYGQDWLESLRNHVATDDPFFTLPPASGGHTPAGGAVSAWFNDDPSTAPVLRRYQVGALDCDGDGTPGDCVKVSTRICWNEPGTCP